MKKKRRHIAKFSVVPAAGALMFFGFPNKKKTEGEYWASVYTTELPQSYSVTLNQPDTDKIYPVLEKNYLGFKEAIAFKESRGNYRTVNQFGYLGKYQFSRNTLKLLGIYNTRKYLLSAKTQEAAFYANCSRNKWVLQRYILKYSGKTINGIEISESGILAAAHLAGPGSVQRFLRSHGRSGFSDAFGTSIGYYMERFKNYDTSIIQPKHYPKAKDVMDAFYTEEDAEWAKDLKV